MCGRMNISDSEGVMILIDALDAAAPEEEFRPRFNVAPSMQINCVVNESSVGSDVDAKQPPNHVCRSFEWGMIPPWAKPGTFKRPLINARSETIREKPSFRGPIKNSRVVIPVNGFYEWKRQGKTRDAWFISGRDQGPLAFAGVSSVSSEGVPQVCVVTTAANERMQNIHHRMPVILDSAAARCWLDDDDSDRLDLLMQPCDDSVIDAVAVSDYVNNARNDGPKCIAPIEKTADWCDQPET